MIFFLICVVQSEMIMIGDLNSSELLLVQHDKDNIKLSHSQSFTQEDVHLKDSSQYYNLSNSAL
jgi:hypothetical protein